MVFYEINNIKQIYIIKKMYLDFKIIWHYMTLKVMCSAIHVNIFDWNCLKRFVLKKRFVYKFI